MPAFRTITVLACVWVLGAGAQAAPLSGEVPLPRHRPAIKGEKLGKAETPKRGALKSEPARGGAAFDRAGSRFGGARGSSQCVAGGRAA